MLNFNKIVVLIYKDNELFAYKVIGAFFVKVDNSMFIDASGVGDSIELMLADNYLAAVKDYGAGIVT